MYSRIQKTHSRQMKTMTSFFVVGSFCSLHCTIFTFFRTATTHVTVWHVTCSCSDVQCTVHLHLVSVTGWWWWWCSLYYIVHHLHASSQCLSYTNDSDRRWDMLSRYPKMKDECSLSVMWHVQCESMHQWKSSLVPVLLFRQNIQTDCLMRPSTNCFCCVRTYWSSRPSDWLARFIWTGLTGNILESLPANW